MQSSQSLRNPMLYRDPDYVRYYGASKETFWTQLCRELVLNAGLKPEDVVADLGCGTGYATREIIKLGVRKVYAIDPSPEMLAASKTNLNCARIIQGTIDDLVGSNLEKPSVILSSGAFVVMPDPKEVLRKIYSYLSQRGRFVFTVENWENNSISGEDILTFLRKVEGLERQIGMDHAFDYVEGERTYSPDEVISLVEKNGGRVVSVTTKDMFYPAMVHFHGDFRLEIIEAELVQARETLVQDPRVVNYLKYSKKKDSLEKEKAIIEEIRALYEEKTWIVGNQYVFDTEKNKIIV